MKRMLVLLAFGLVSGVPVTSGQGMREMDPNNLPKGMPAGEDFQVLPAGHRALIDPHAKVARLPMVLRTTFLDSPEVALDGDLEVILHRMSARIQMAHGMEETQRARLIESIHTELLQLQIERDKAKRQADDGD